MKILLYFDGIHPFETRSWSSIESFWHFLFQGFVNALRKHEDVEFKVIASEHCMAQFQYFKEHPEIKTSIQNIKELDEFFSNTEVYEIADSEIKACFSEILSMHEIYIKDFNEALSVQEYEALSNLILGKLKGWSPDLVFTHPLNLKFLRRIFFSSLVFVQENAIFSRRPLPLSFYYDAVGSIEKNFLKSFSSELNAVQISPENYAKVEVFKKNVKEYFRQNYKTDEIMAPIRERWEKLILVPLIGSFRAGSMSRFPDDASVIQYVMENVPAHVGVIFTDHRGIQPLPEGKIIYYRKKWKNFLYIPELQELGMPSVGVFPYIDAVINHYSMTGVMARLIWDIPVVPLDGYYNDWIKDCQSVDELEHVFDTPPAKKTHLLWWYMTHYAVPEKHFLDKDFYYIFFMNKLNAYRKNGITFDLYEYIGDFPTFEFLMKERKKKGKQELHFKLLAEVGSMLKKLGSSLIRAGDALKRYKYQG